MLQSQSLLPFFVPVDWQKSNSIASTAGIIAHLAGKTVEMHGNINQLVCPSCGVVVLMTPGLLRKLRSKKAIPCSKCDCQAVRCRIMLYDDAEGTSQSAQCSLNQVHAQSVTCPIPNMSNL